MRVKGCLTCKHSDWGQQSKICELCGPFSRWEPKELPAQREGQGVFAIGDKVMVNYPALNEVRIGKVVAVSPIGEDRIEVLYPKATKPVSIHKSAIIGITFTD